MGILLRSHPGEGHVRRLRGRRLLWTIIASLALIVGVAFLARNALAGALVPVVGRAFGYDIRAGQIRLGWHRAQVVSLDVRSASGEPILAARRIDAALDLAHAFSHDRTFDGITALEIDRPRLTIVHHRDGTYNVPVSNGKPGGNAPAQEAALPRIDVRITNGSAEILDPYRLYAEARRIGVTGFNLAAHLTPAGRSHYALAFALAVSGRNYPVRGRAVLDPARGFESQRFTAAELPLGPLVNYALNSSKVNLASARLTGVDACLCGLSDRSGNLRGHITGTAFLDRFKLYLGGLQKPIRDGRGRVYLYDEGVTAPLLRATIAGLPLRVTGALYGLSSPTFRLGVTGGGALDQLVAVVNRVRYPLRGQMRVGLLVEGDAANPLVLMRFASPGIGYGAYPIARPAGAVALQGTEATILRTTAAYGPLSLGALGAVTLGRHTDFELLASLRARSERLPCLSLLLPPMPLEGTAVLSGRDAATGGTGMLTGTSAVASLSAPFSIDRTGSGSIGPLLLDGPHGTSVYARAALDKAHGTYAVVASLHHVEINSAAVAANFPGMRVPALPPLSGAIDGGVVSVVERNAGAASGDLSLSGLRVRGIDAGSASVRGAGAVALHGTTVSGGRGAFDGRYRGSLDRLAALFPGKVAATGRLDVPFRVALNGNSTVAQIDGARFDGVRVAGLRIRALAGTFGLRQARAQAVDVYAADAQLDGGGSVTASGSFGNGGTLRVAASGVNLASLGAASPIAGGRVDAMALVGGTVQAPSVTAGVALRDGRYRQFNVGASTLLAFTNGRLRIDDGLMQAGPAVASLSGNVDGLSGGDPRAARYTLDARMRDADVATLASVARSKLPYPAGTLDAELQVSGRGTLPNVRGQIRLPEGSLNGLAFRNATVHLAGTRADLQADGGDVTVGSSRIAFAGSFASRRGTLSVRAPSLDLADFNNYFDAGDTLGGAGRANATVSFSQAAVASTGNVALAGARYRRFALGDARATWATAGRTIVGSGRIAGSTGTFSAKVSATLAATAPLRDALHRTSIALDARAQRMDLSTWLPAAGLHAPIEGFVDANATVRGNYPNLDVAANGSLAQGLVGHIPVRRLELALNAARGRATLSDAVLEIPELSANANGTFGLRPSDAFDLNVRATSPDIGALQNVVTGKKAAYDGALDATARLQGTMKRPQLSAVVALQKVTYRGYTLPSARADVSYANARVDLRDVTVALQRGTLTARGAVPLQTPPATMLPPDAPIALTIAAQGVEFSQFAALLPKGTQLAGSLDGSVAVGGTATAPELNGALSVAKLTYFGPQERTPITDGVAQLAFAGTTISLQNAHAKAGGGTIGAQAKIELPNLRDPSRATVAFEATASDAVLDLPQYFKGRVNGNVTVTRTPGTTPVVGGQVAFDKTRVPLTAVFNPNSAKSSGPSTMPDVALNLGVTVGSDVRVQSSSVDIGAQGNLHVGGTLSSPALKGKMDSTGGSLNFYRDFLLQSGTLTFSPEDGVVPDIHAVATTQVPDPPTYVTLTVTGLATGLNVALASDPGYSREQILGLLVGAQSLGAVSGLATTGSAPQSNLVQSVAAGELGNLLTRNLLEPFSAQLGNSIGLQSLGIAYNAGQGGLGLNASKRLFADVNAVYAQTFNYPQRQSIGVRITPNRSTAVQLTFFTQPGSGQFINAPTSLLSSNVAVSSSEPENGTNGYSFTIQRRFW